MKMTKQHYEKL